jgi:hypothetical protein
MTLSEIEALNAAWLQAWTDKDAAAVAAFYSEDCVYKDAQTAAGLIGRAALKGYLEALFAATPAMAYRADAVWAIDGGFCGRWFCDIEGGARLRGFDLVLLAGGEIAYNEVYTHSL